MPRASHDPDERHVEALAESIRRGIASGHSDEEIETLARAVLGDDDERADEADRGGDEPPER